MRIIGGELSGLRFNPPAKKWPTRPTTDISKEGLYNILSNTLYFEDIKFLDLFGGTGNHCYEVISRGCTDATYVDKFPGAVKFVKEMAAKFKIEDRLRIVKMDVFKFMSVDKAQYDYIFAGPPYPLKTIKDIPDLIIKNDMLKPDGLLVLEHNPTVNLKDHPHLQKQRNYGQTIFSFFRLS